MVDLTEKVVFVTGPSEGIGSAIARAVVEQGARVILHGQGSAQFKALSEKSHTILLVFSSVFRVAATVT